MFFLYQITISILLIFSPFIIIYRILKNKEDKIRFIEKFGVSTKKRQSGNLIWFHGASVGEILSVIPIIKYYEKKKLVHQILITSSTLSSLKVLQKYNLKKTTHQFYPIDHIFFTNKFLNYWKPSVAIFIDSEIWPSMFKRINKKNIPLTLLNARFNQRSIKRWLKVKNFTKKIFNNITKAYPQNLETEKFLKKINCTKINFIGNLKFAQSFQNSQIKIEKNLKEQFRNKKIWVASSTHENEEIICAKAHIEIKKKIKNLITIIIPRHIHRAHEIAKKIKNLNLKVSLVSNKEKNIKNVDIFLIDSFGETEKFYKISPTVFMGKSLPNASVGGQNPIEPARCGAKILHGPFTDNFKDVYKLFRKLNISKIVTNPKNLAASITFKREQNIRKKINKIGRKILKETIKELDNLIINEIKKT